MSRCTWKSSLIHKNHPIIKTLIKRGFVDFEIAWSSRALSDAGWTVINTSHEDRQLFGEWLGFTIKESLDTINKYYPEKFIKVNNNDGNR